MPYVPPPFLPLPEGAKPLLDPRNDLVFKMIFADAPDLLTHLINAVRHDSPPIRVERILNPSITPEDVTRKFIALDILAVDECGHRFNIEMQMRRHPFGMRAVYTTSPRRTPGNCPGAAITAIFGRQSASTC